MTIDPDVEGRIERRERTIRELVEAVEHLVVLIPVVKEAGVSKEVVHALSKLQRAGEQAEKELRG